MKLVFFDLEIYPNMFTCVFYDPYIKQYKSYTLYTNIDGKIEINEIKELKAYLKASSDIYFVGYNSLGYDMQILTQMLKMPVVTNLALKEFNDELINSEWPIYRENQLCNKTIDLMLINNYGPRSAKSSSLKKLEFNLRKKKIQDLPYHFNDYIKTIAQVDEIIKYCKYDVEVTLDVFRFSKELLTLRLEFGELNGLDLINSTEPDIAKKYMLKQLSTDLEIDENEVKKLKTYNDSITISNCLLDYIKNYKFKNDLLGSTLDFYSNIVLQPTIKSNIDPGRRIINLKNAISKVIPYYDGEIVYAAGGLHFSTKPGVYESDEQYVIIDWDKVSYYPHFAMKHDVVPKHLGKSYGKFLLNTFNERKKYSKKTHPIVNHSLKIILNASYGMGNSEYSFLYDTEATIGTTVNGMLTLTMMVDMLESNLSYFYPLQFNTDGLTFIIKRSEIHLAISLFDKLTEIDNIPYEYVEYKKMIINDVNNYIAMDTYNNIKPKGLFEDYNDITNAGNYSKDTSAMIIPKALKAYFINGISIEETINKENSIYEFCYGNKGSNSYRWMLTNYNPTKGLATSELFDSRFVRYYAGGYQTLSQLWTKGARTGTIQAVQAQTPITLLMNVPKEDILDLDRYGNHKPRLNKDNEIIYRYPHLNRQWYINEANKIVNQIENI